MIIIIIIVIIIITTIIIVVVVVVVAVSFVIIESYKLASVCNYHALSALSGREL